jgi:putative colanic acid biosynthesis UDP-glucose lipid carrier transferase
LGSSKWLRGEIQNVDDIHKRVEYDIWYIEKWSLLLDVQVILLTIYNIVQGEEKLAKNFVLRVQPYKKLLLE